MSKIHTATRTRVAPVYKALFLCALLLCLSGGVMAQDSSSNPLDGFTPAGLQPGAPAGSYRLSGFDTINPYNGYLNFSLPLLQVGGRGGAGYTIQQLISSKWTVTYNVTHDDRGGTTEFFQPSNDPWSYLKPGYSPGVLVGRSANEGSMLCDSPIYNGPVYFPTATLTRLTFIGADGTEYELRDKNLGGRSSERAHLPDDGDKPGKYLHDLGRPVGDFHRRRRHHRHVRHKPGRVWREWLSQAERRHSLSL
jgi:hypothetical protein